MGNWIVNLPSDVDFKTSLDKMITAGRKMPFIQIYVKELPDYQTEGQTWLFVYKPLIFGFHQYIVLAAFASSLFFGFGKLFFGLLSISLVMSFFFSKYFPMAVIWYKYHKKGIKLV